MTEESPVPPLSTPDWLLFQLATQPDTARALQAIISRETAFKPKDEEIAQIASQLGWKDRPLKQLLTLLENIYKYVHQTTDDGGRSDDDIRIELLDIVASFPYLENIEDAPEKAIAALIPLMRFNPAAEMRRKEEAIRKGALPNATGFSTVVELRPVFSIDRKTVSKYITAIQFKVTTDKKGSEDVLFQIYEDDIATIREVLDVLEDKIKTLHSTLSAEGTISDPSTATQR